MRYLLYAAIVVFAAAVWFNTSHHGVRIQRQLSEHPADPGQLWAR